MPTSDLQHRPVPHQLRARSLCCFWLAALVFMAMCTGCERVYYETYGFEWQVVGNPHGLDIGIVTAGMSRLRDSSGVRTAVSASPYWVGIYFYNGERVPGPAALVSATFAGEQSGAVLQPDLGPLTVLGNGSTMAAVATEVDLPFEDYQVHLRVKLPQEVGGAEVNVTGRLKKKLERRGAFRILEELQG